MRTILEVESEMESIRNEGESMRAILSKMSGYGTEKFIIPEPHETRRKSDEARYLALKDKLYEIEVAVGLVDPSGIRVNLACAGIGEGDEHPMRKHYFAMPGEIDEESPRRF